MLIGLSVVTLAYVLINISVFHVIPAEKLVGLGNTASAEAAKALFGDIGSKIVNIGVIISIFGCLNGKIITFPRIPFAMAEDGLLPLHKYVGYISPKLKSPLGALMTVFGISVILIILTILFPNTVNADYLSEVTIFIIYLFYMMAFVGLFILRKQNKGTKRDYSVPLYPFVPLLALFGGAFIIINTLISDFMGSLYSLIILAIGVPVYMYLNKNKQRRS